jgi:glutamate dehydrogenase (NAD(P)+)
MAGAGAALAARAALGGTLRGARVAIQGAGALGIATAFRADAFGARVVAISDAEGSILDPDGIAVDSLSARLAAGRREAPRDAVFEADADVLVLAGSSNSVGETIARRIVPRVIVEASTFGLQHAARIFLNHVGKHVVPDVVAASSSAAMVAHQLASGGNVEASELWSRIETAIDSSTRFALAGAGPGLTSRDAHVGRFMTMVAPLGACV